MTKFEMIGADIQYSAVSKRDAQKSFRYSCNLCCTRGIRIECDNCAIANAHSLVLASFEAAKVSPDTKCAMQA